MGTTLQPRDNYIFSVLASAALLPSFLKLLYKSLVSIHQCVRMISQKLGFGERNISAIKKKRDMHGLMYTILGIGVNILYFLAYFAHFFSILAAENRGA